MTEYMHVLISRTPTSESYLTGSFEVLVIHQGQKYSASTPYISLVLSSLAFSKPFYPQRNNMTELQFGLYKGINFWSTS